MNKFSDDVEQTIITRYLSGESTVILGRAYGTSKTHIQRILTRHQIERRNLENVLYALMQNYTKVIQKY